MRDSAAKGNGVATRGVMRYAHGNCLTSVRFFSGIEWRGWGLVLSEFPRRCLGAALVAYGTFCSSVALAQDSYSAADPAGSGAIVSAIRWLQGTLLGTVATVVAVIAVASVGFMMLTGRMNWRYGATVILGCFILFGAASIVAGIQSTAGLGG